MCWYVFRFFLHIYIYEYIGQSDRYRSSRVLQTSTDKTDLSFIAHSGGKQDRPLYSAVGFFVQSERHEGTDFKASSSSSNSTRVLRKNRVECTATRRCE